MPFRANESENNNFESALGYLARSLPEAHRRGAKSRLVEIVDELGPVIDGYPSWHPIVANQLHPESPCTKPQDGCGYRGLDHTILFRNGFLTCPYGGVDEVIASVEELPEHEAFRFQVKKLKGKLYQENAFPVLVKCCWESPLARDGTIPLPMATGLLLEQELPAWRTSHHAETWETMRTFFLGTPCGSRSSLFVNETTGQGLKRLWNMLVQTGVFGPVNVAGVP